VYRTRPDKSKKTTSIENLVQLRKSWLIQKKFADLRYERKGFIALLAPAYLPAGRQVCG
jgi:hypothetical protein